MGERVQDQALRGQAPRLAHGSHLTHGLFETRVTSPACRATSPHPCRVTAMGWRDRCPQPSPVSFPGGVFGVPQAQWKNLVVIVEARVQWDNSSVSYPFLALFTALGRQRYQGPSGPSRFIPWARARSARNVENARLESGAQPPWREVSVVLSMQRRLPRGGGMGAQPWKMHRIRRGKKGQTMRRDFFLS